MSDVDDTLISAAPETHNACVSCHDAGSGALIRLILREMADGGPRLSRILADLGFEVIKVERPGGGDWSRYVPPLDPQSGQGLLFGALNRGKKSLTLNLKSDEGRAILLRLVESADVLLESFRPGVMERLGLGYEDLVELNPRLVYARSSGWGDEGPYVERGRGGHDMMARATGGLFAPLGPGGLP